MHVYLFCFFGLLLLDFLLIILLLFSQSLSSTYPPCFIVILLLLAFSVSPSANLRPILRCHSLYGRGIRCPSILRSHRSLGMRRWLPLLILLVDPRPDGRLRRHCTKLPKENQRQEESQRYRTWGQPTDRPTDVVPRAVSKVSRRRRWWRSGWSRGGGGGLLNEFIDIVWRCSDVSRSQTALPGKLCYVYSEERDSEFRAKLLLRSNDAEGHAANRALIHGTKRKHHFNEITEHFYSVCSKKC